MAYGSIYEFLFNSNNGADVKIVILKSGYNGPTMQRSLGRAPIMRRERNGCILGTSLELYAECYVDGEYAQLYTSSADEYRVEVYINQVFMWVGYVSPELYSEPDIAPPYDVRIIATDGLGELKNYEFQSADSVRTLDEHISQMLLYTGLNLDYRLISQLSYKDASGLSSPKTIFDSLSVNLSNHNGRTCYDVIQNILASMNMVLTQDQKTWTFIRETDVYSLLDDHYSVAFGHSSDDWWTIGNLSTDIIPAKKQVVVSYEDSYKDTLLGNSYMTHEESWDMDNSYYDDIEQGYILRSSGSAISQSIDFQYGAVRRQLLLSVRARCLTDIDSDKPSRLGVKIRMTGGVSSFTSRELYLDYGRPQGYERSVPIWSSYATGGFILNWASPKVNSGDPEIKEISIILPFFIPQDNGYYGYAYADSISVELYNPDDTFPICIYECVLTQYIRNKGVRNTLLIDNGARERENDIESIINSSKKYGLSAAITMKGILIGDEDITEWSSASQSGDDLLMLIGRDYAQSVALPRMRYKGTLNVPNTDSPKIPILFVRDNTYYLLNTYSYDLYNDEIEVELISIPTADISLESESVVEIPAESNGNVGSGSGGSGGSGGGGGEINILNNWDAYNPTANQVLGANLGIELYDWLEWIEDEGWGDSIEDINDELYYINEDIAELDGRVTALENNPGGGGVSYEGITGIMVNGQTYEDTDDDKVIVLPDYPTTVAELTDSADYAKVSDLEDIIDDIESIDSWIADTDDAILALQAEDERLAAIIANLGAVAEMFVWDDEEHTRIRTDYDFFSKKTISSGGKATPSGEGGGGSIDLSDYATIDYVDSNFLPATYDSYYKRYDIDADIYVVRSIYTSSIEADELYTYGDFWGEGNVGTDGNLEVWGDAEFYGDLYMSDDYSLYFAQGVRIYGNQGGLNLDAEQDNILLHSYVEAYNGMSVWCDGEEVVYVGVDGLYVTGEIAAIYGAYIEGVLHADELSVSAGAYIEGDLGVADGDIYLDPDMGIHFYQNAYVYAKQDGLWINIDQGDLHMENMSVQCDESLEFCIMEEQMLVIFPDGISVKGEIYANADIYSPTIDDIHDRLDVIEARLGI